MPPAFHDLTPADDHPAGPFPALCALYEDTIPASERKPLSTLRAMLARPADYRFTLARDPATGHPVAFAVTFHGSPDAALLEYLAVSPTHRSQGLGSSLFRHVAASLPCPLLVETDSPGPPGPDQPLRQRRLSFYRRLNCLHLAGLPYQLPLPTNPPPMWLLLHPPASTQSSALTPPSSFPLPTLRTYLTTLYTRVYDQPPDDPRIPAMLAGLPDPLPLR